MKIRELMQQKKLATFNATIDGEVKTFCTGSFFGLEREVVELFGNRPELFDLEAENVKPWLNSATSNG